MTAPAAPRLFVGGPATWNLLVYVDVLPAPHPHSEVVRAHHETVGGTSAGKALNLRPLLARVREAGVPLVCDLHDYDGTNPFHQDFVDAGDVLFLNDDAMPHPVPWMRERVAAGASLAVVTQGAGGATAVTRDEVLHVPAPTVREIVDTNGAGDAFVASFLMARLGGAALPEAMAAGHRQAARCLAVPDLAPSPTGC